MALASPFLPSVPPSAGMAPPASIKVVLKTKAILSKQAEKIAQQAEEHEKFINKVTYCLGVVAFGTLCFLLGSRPQDVPYLYCIFFLTIAPLRWIYYRIKKWHYYLLDFCYYANAIFMLMLLFFPNNDKLFLVCFAFAEGPLSWALIVWRCSLVFSSIDKIISVLIHLLPGTVFFIIRWWDPSTFLHHSREDAGPWPAWPSVATDESLWMWLFIVPLFVYSMWQVLYFLVVNVLRRQRFLKDPEVMTSYRELSRKASRANNIWWRLSGLMGDSNRVIMYAVLQALFTVATMALTVPMFKSYRFHIAFEFFKVATTIWNGGSFFFEVMPRQMNAREKKQKGDSICWPKSESNTLPIPSTDIQISDASADGLTSPSSAGGDLAVCPLCRSSSGDSLALDSPSGHRIKEDPDLSATKNTDTRWPHVREPAPGQLLGQRGCSSILDGYSFELPKRRLTCVN